MNAIRNHCSSTIYFCSSNRLGLLTSLKGGEASGYWKNIGTFGLLFPHYRGNRFVDC